MAEHLHADARDVCKRGRRVSRPHSQSVLALCPIREPDRRGDRQGIQRPALKDLADPKDPTKIARKAGEQLAGFAELRDDGTHASGCWIFCGRWTEAGNLMARRDNSDPTGIGQTLNWAWAWPANRRMLYNRASCDPTGKPFDPNRKLIEWNGKAWGGVDVPDFKADENPASGMGPFIMKPEGVARFFAGPDMAEGPFPEHYEPFESPLGYNPLFPDKPQATNNPAARVFPDDRDGFGKDAQFPHVATTYRLTEHFHYWTKHARLNAIVQPQQFVEIGEGLAKEIGIATGDRVKVSSNRGYIKAVAMVTKRIKPMKIDGKVRAHGRHTDSLGIHGRRQSGISRQYADAVGRRRQYADAGIQVLPGQGREGLGDTMPLQSLDIRRRSATTMPDPRCAAHTRARSRSSSTRPSASAARPARSPAWNGTICAMRSAPAPGITTTRPIFASTPGR